VIATFLGFLNAELIPLGGRAVLTSNYGPVPINPASYIEPGTGICN